MGNRKETQGFIQTAGQYLFVLHGQEWMKEWYIFLRENAIHIGGNGFRVGSDHWTHECVFTAFVWSLIHTGVPDEVRMAFQQPVDMAMYQFGWITFRIGGNGFHRFHWHIPHIIGRKNDSKTQSGKECVPEWVILIHVKYSGDTYRPPGRVGKRPIRKQAAHLPAVHIGETGVRN